jgi:hypothetical protein
LTRADSRALWNAVQWMDAVLRGWDGNDNPEQRAREVARYADAKRALRKVQAIVRSEKKARSA